MNEKCCIHFQTSRAVKERMYNPSRQPFPPLAPTNSYPDVRVLPSHRREQAFLLSLCLCNGFPTFCLLFSVPLLLYLAKTIFWSSDIPVSWFLITRLLFIPFNLPLLTQLLLDTIDLTGPIHFSLSSTLLPLKFYGLFCLLLSTVCFFEYFSDLILQDPLRSETFSLWVTAHFFSQETKIPQIQIVVVLARPFPCPTSQLLPIPAFLGHCSTMVKR